MAAYAHRTGYVDHSPDKHRVWLIEESETTVRDCPAIHTPLDIVIWIEVMYVVCISLLHYQR